MATIYNSDLTKEITTGAGIQTSRDVVPSQLGQTVVPVMEVNPKMLRRINVVRSVGSTATGTLSVYTTPTDRDFYLTNVYFAMVKNAACDVATGILSCQATSGVLGQTAHLATMPVITLNAEDKVIAQTFECPMKLDRGITIQAAANFAAGAMSRYIVISGYIVDTSNA